MAKNKLSLVRVEVPSLTVGAYGMEGNRSELFCALKVISATEALLSSYKVVVAENIAFNDGELIVNCFESEESPSQYDETIKSSLNAFNFVDDMKVRFHTAYENQKAILRTPVDIQAIAFNKTVSTLADKYKAGCVLLPSSSHERRYVVVDPRTLECPEPSESRMIHVENARVTGAREACAQMDLPFDGQENIDVLVSIRHNLVTDVLYPTTVAAGQSCWKGITRTTCDVLIERGKIPRVVGDAIFTREG
jgi:hypothetical protein